MSERRAMRAAATVIVLGVLMLGRPCPVKADVAAGRTALVQLTIAAPDPVVDAIAARLAARLGQRGAVLKVQVVPRVSPAEALNAPALSDPDAALARVWLDAGGPDEVALFLVPPAADRVLARKLALPSGVDEVALAEIVFIVDGATQALQAARPIGVPREEALAALHAAEVPPAVAPLSARRSRLTFQLGVMGGARAWSGSASAVPEAALYLLAERRGQGVRVGVAFDGALRRDVQTETADAQLTTGMTALHLWLTLARPFAGAGVGRVMLGPSLAVAEVASTQRAGAGRFISPRTRTDLEWAVGALLRWELTLADRVVVFVAAGADFVPAPTRYTAQVDGTTSVVLSTWPVRPTALLGAAIDLPAL